MISTVHDVAILADFRFAGPGVAAEVQAQAEAALTTVLVHVPRDPRVLPFAPHIQAILRDGSATLAREDQIASVRLLVARGADLLAAGRARTRAEHIVVVAGEPPIWSEEYDDVEWAPADDRVRVAMPLLCKLTVQNWHEIVDAAATWHDDPERFRALERTSGHQSHLRRLAGFGIRPRISAPAVPREPGPTPPGPTRRVLLAGSPARLTAIARRLPGDLAAVIATDSYESPGDGFLTEHIPAYEEFGAPRDAWNRMLRDRLSHLVELHRPEIVAVDDLPHPGIVEAVRAHPEVLWVWVRRAMWKRSPLNTEWLTEGKVFDHVLEPGEFAAMADDGPTVAERETAHRVEPITLLDAGELLDAAAARADLGLDDRPAALVRLDDTRIVERLERHGFQVVVRTTAVSRYLRAFDLAVSAADYDAYHEQLRFGIPTVFVPSGDDPLDDQAARARFADASGVALTVSSGDDLDRALDAIARPEKRAALSRRCEELTFSNGASAAATWLGGLAARHDRTGG
ncbi:glycosyl transferase [Actinoplanes bogorensis]|uniref:Glycosyl transferase n=1 Tax=Paractinoplanes bogorensis TaxID=1610840 RepID=A0ABS5YFR1_9ACTN|nr:glycosyl transferase [Actinoplanes bogorensis]MBU2662152.1 glycosyl transferase [Actinoplanes bogorensis]